MCSNLRRRLQAWQNSRQTSNPESVVGNCDTDDGSDCHGLSLLSLELSVESLGKHNRSHSLLGLQSHRAANIRVSLRQIPYNCRTRIQRADYLVRVAVARLAWENILHRD